MLSTGAVPLIRATKVRCYRDLREPLSCISRDHEGFQDYLCAWKTHPVGGVLQRGSVGCAELDVYTHKAPEDAVADVPEVAAPSLGRRPRF